MLNLNAPSALLGFQLGGIVGHKFLSNYRVGIDLEHSVLRLKADLRLKDWRRQVASFFRSRCSRAARALPRTPALLVGLDQQRRHRHACAIAGDGDEGQKRAAGQLPLPVSVSSE